jgi:hypothetical protein
VAGAFSFSQYGKIGRSIMSEQTTVQSSETPFEKIRKVLDFHLDEKGEPWGTFIAEDDQRRFPLKSKVIQAYLHEAVQGADKPKEKLEALTYECVRHATKSYRPKKDRDEDLLFEEDGLLLAILNMLARLKKKGHKPEFSGTAKQLRSDLLDGPKEEHLSEEEKKTLKERCDWPEAPHKFAIYLRARQNVLASFKIKLSYKRSGTARMYTLKYVGDDGNGDLHHVRVTQADDDLFEILGLYDPKPTVTDNDAGTPPQASHPTNGEATVTKGETEKGQQASGPALERAVTLDDAQREGQASRANQEGKHVRERLGNTEEKGEEVLDAEPKQQTHR